MKTVLFLLALSLPTVSFADGTGDHPISLREMREGQFAVSLQRVKMGTAVVPTPLASTARIEKAWLLLAPWMETTVDKAEMPVTITANGTKTLTGMRIDRDEADSYTHTLYAVDVTDFLKTDKPETFTYTYDQAKYYDADALVVMYEDQTNLPYRETFVFFGAESLKNNAVSTTKFNRTAPGDASGMLQLFLTADDDQSDSTLSMNGTAFAQGSLFGAARRSVKATADFPITVGSGPQEFSIKTSDWLSVDLAVISLEPPVY